ncbi:hypothetical protein TYRP_001929 [Tyrophagus putrescentiae]|nr:hypothetical protein TYRP_001929 [Tyrophagus putrescentiae]
MARTKRGHRDHHLIDDHETDTDDDDSPPGKPTAIPKDWKSRCFKDLHWCKHFLLGLYVNNMLDKIPGISFVPPTMSPSQKAAIKEECKGNEKCIWKKTKKWDDKNVLPELVKAALAGGGGGDSSDDSHTTDGRSGRQSNMGLIIAVAVASGIISLLLLLILIYCCCCTGKRNKSPKSNVRINNVAVRSSKKSKKRPKSSTKRRLSFKSKSAKKSSRKSQKSSKKKPQLEIQVQ